MTTNQIHQDKDYLRNSQYRDSSHLDARATLHQRFSTTQTEWFDWILAHAALANGMTVLEVGGGPGWLWRKTRDQLPETCEITVTDFSSGMVAEAEMALSDDPQHRFRFEVVNIEEIPFADASFDVVIGNHMLYHVPNLAKGLREVRRVLKPNGRFLAATNGRKHMYELQEMKHQLFPEIYEALMSGFFAKGMPARAFSLENGRSLLDPWFSKVDLHLFDDALVVTEADPIINYLLSSEIAQEMATPQRRAFARKKLDAWLARDGAIHIQKSTCLFIAHQ